MCLLSMDDFIIHALALVFDIFTSGKCIDNGRSLQLSSSQVFCFGETDIFWDFSYCQDNTKERISTESLGCLPGPLHLVSPQISTFVSPAKLIFYILCITFYPLINCTLFRFPITCPGHMQLEISKCLKGKLQEKYQTNFSILFFTQHFDFLYHGCFGRLEL